MPEIKTDLCLQHFHPLCGGWTQDGQKCTCTCHLTSPTKSSTRRQLTAIEQYQPSEFPEAVGGSSSLT